MSAPLPTARVELYGRNPAYPTIVVEIPAELWAPNEGIEHPGNARLFKGSLVVNGQPLHLAAIQVETDSSGFQSANAAEYEDDMNALASLTGADGPFATSPGVETGQRFVIYAAPYGE